MNKHKTLSHRTASSFVTFRLAKLQSSLNAQATAILKTKAGLSLVEWRLIQTLRIFEDVTMSEIADFLQMDKGQLSRNVKAMLKKGLLRSERDTEDKRVQHLYLTKAALEISYRVMPVMETRQKFLLAEVAPDDLKIFYRIINKLESASKIREIE